MVELYNIEKGRDMVRRDPHLLDTFPDRNNEIATDYDRETLRIPPSARINAPLLQSRDQIREWAKGLEELAVKIQARSTEDCHEKYFLADVYGLIRSFDRPTLALLKNHQRTQNIRNSRMTESDIAAEKTIVDKSEDR